MGASSRFAVAIHIMVALAVGPRYGYASQTSDRIAGSVNTNPVVIRRLLGRLRQAGLVESTTGPEGGSSLARPADQINLDEIYAAVEEGALFHLHYSEPNKDCPIGCNIRGVLGGVFSEAENSLKANLGQTNLAQLVQQMQSQPAAG